MSDWQNLMSEGSFGFNTALLDDLNATGAPAKTPAKVPEDN